MARNQTPDTPEPTFKQRYTDGTAPPAAYLGSGRNRSWWRTNATDEAV